MQKALQTSSATFRDLIEGGFLYVDKTRHLYELIRESKGFYFLSRPRRFGKSLFVSTLDEVFRGNKALFQGLWLYECDYSWERYPVIRIDFSQERVRSAQELEETILAYIHEIAKDYDVTLEKAPYQRMFRRLIHELSKNAQVVILIDEYDKPLIDNLGEIEEARQIQEVMRSFYTTIKAMDAYIRFVFITGITKFSKVGVFSTMNNLTDLSMTPRFATMLGLTENELWENFHEHIIRFAEKEGLSEEAFMAKMAAWYNGFRFTQGEENVYNPYSILNLFFHQMFSNYWFESGTPTFLINLIKERQYDLFRFQKISTREIGFSTFELDYLDIIPLLYQTGYLTIKSYEAKQRRYRLSYPNREVKESFLSWLISAYSYTGRGINEAHLWEMVDALNEGNLQEMFDILAIFFANIPYDLHVKHEKYYQTIFYLLFMMIGFRIHAEVQTNDGRIDAVVEVDDQIYLFEFKLDKTAEEAMTQIQDHQYYQKYQSRGKPITCIGANFNTKMRTVDDWQAVTI